MKIQFIPVLYLFLLLLGCRTSLPTYVKAPQQGLPQEVRAGNEQLPLVSAHRGGRYYKGYPENSLELFAYTSSQVRAIIECDISMSKDSVLLLMHDRNLDRTTTGKGKVMEKTWTEIQTYRLKDDFDSLTTFRVPSLEQTLTWARNKAWLSLDVKREVPYAMVVDAIHQYKAENYAAVITYNLDGAKEVYRLDSTLLISVGIRNLEELERYKKSGIPMKNMIAFTGTREPAAELYEALHREGVVCMLGTLGNLDRKVQAKGDHLYKDFRQRGADILATDRPIEATRALLKK